MFTGLFDKAYSKSVSYRIDRLLLKFTMDWYQKIVRDVQEEVLTSPSFTHYQKHCHSLGLFCCTARQETGLTHCKLLNAMLCLVQPMHPSRDVLQLKQQHRRYACRAAAANALSTTGPPSQLASPRRPQASWL